MSHTSCNQRGTCEEDSIVQAPPPATYLQGAPGSLGSITVFEKWMEIHNNFLNKLFRYWKFQCYASWTVFQSVITLQMEIHKASSKTLLCCGQFLGTYDVIGACNIITLKKRRYSNQWPPVPLHLFRCVKLTFLNRSPKKLTRKFITWRFISWSWLIHTVMDKIVNCSTVMTYSVYHEREKVPPWKQIFPPTPLSS